MTITTSSPSPALLVLLLLLGQLASWVPASAQRAVVSERDRVVVVNRILEERLEDLLPVLMREAEIDLWIVVCREYAEDPVFFSLVPEPVHAARRTTMLIFHDRGGEQGVERLTVSRYAFGTLYEGAWEGGDLDEQWSRMAEIVAERDPQRIGINVSRHWPMADGLTASLRDRLQEVLPKKYRERLVPAEDLVVRWFETRSAGELTVWPRIVGYAREVIAEAFSARTIVPGVTTTEDLAWAIREGFEERGLEIWFQPDVNVQRQGDSCLAESPYCGAGERVIQPGDVLHTDVGICYLRLCTDTQEMGYVALDASGEVPAALVGALKVGNRWQDLLTAEFEEGRSGNEILAAALAAAQAEGIDSAVYSHPLGAFGHAPGPTIGMWDNQGATPVRGDWPLHASTGYAIEGNIKVPVPEWQGQHVQIKLEQSAVFDGEKVIYLAGRQTEWHVID